MTPAEAYHVLQLEPGAGREQIEQSYAEQTRVFKEKRAKAPSPGHKAHFQQGLARLTAAHDVLIQREDAAAGAARRRQGAAAGRTAGPAEAEARVVTAAEVDAAADRLPRRLNRHMDGGFFALLATLAGGLAGALTFGLFAEDAGRRALFVGSGLGVGLVPGIFWWRATVQRLRRAEWIRLREALERGETLTVAWRRQALRLATVLLLFLGFSVGYRQWSRWPTLRPEEDAGMPTAGGGEPLAARRDSGVPARINDGAVVSPSPDRSPRAASPAREPARPADTRVDHERPRDQETASAFRPKAEAPTAIRPEDPGSPSIPPPARQTNPPAREANQVAARESVKTDERPARAPTAGATASPTPVTDEAVAGLVGEPSAAAQRDARMAGGGSPARDQATATASAPGRPRRVAQILAVPPDVAQAEAARASGGNPAAIRARLAKAYRAWAKRLREAGQPGLALFALDQAKAAGLADEEDLAATLRKEFTQTHALTVWLTPPQLGAVETEAALAAETLEAVATELDHALHETLAPALPAVVALRAADARTVEVAARGPRLVLRVEAPVAENAPPASAETPRDGTPGEASASTEPLPRRLRASVVWVNGVEAQTEGNTEENAAVLLSVHAELRADPGARAPSQAEEADAWAAAGSELRARLRAGMPELVARLAEAALAVMQARRAAAAGDAGELPGDLAWGWFSVWAEAGLVLPQGDAELAARRALALPEAQPVEGS